MPNKRFNKSNNRKSTRGKGRMNRPIKNPRKYTRRLDRKSRFSLTSSFEGKGVADRTFAIVEVTEGFTDVPANQVLKYTWIANGLFDPFAASASAQPSWFKPWMNMYAKYKVLNSRINIQLVNTTNGSPYEISVFPSVESVNVNSVAEAKNQRYSTSRLIGPASGMSNAYLSNMIAVQKLFGRNVMGDEGFSGDFGSNPSYQCYWQVFLSTLDGSNILPSFLASITYRVVFYGVLPQGMTTPGLSAMWNERMRLEKLKLKDSFDIIEEKLE